MISVIAFMTVNCVGYILALTRGPYWALLVYVNIYFNPPIYKINWWAASLPFQRWSLLTSAILFISLFLHRDKVSTRKLSCVNWLFIFTLISILITYTYAPYPKIGSEFTYKLITFCITSYFIIKSIDNLQQYKVFCLFIIILASNLALKGYLYGNRINNRLEGAGTADAAGSNEFALLLINIIPLTIPFIIHGKKYEKIICLLGLPFLANAFILCNSRGMLLSLVLSLMMVPFILPDKTIKKYIILITLVGVPAFTYLADPQFISRMETLLSSSDAMSDESASADLTSGRTEIWKHGFQIALDHPLGAGPESFRELAHFYMPPHLLTFKDPSRPHGVRSAHNTYLQTLVEQGVLGLLVLLLMIIQTFRLLRSSIKKLKELNSSNSFLGLSVFAVTLSFSTSIFGGLSGSRIYYEFFWWQVALSVVLHSLVLNFVNNLPDTDTDPT